jgi:hypothetical protein
VPNKKATPLPRRRCRGSASRMFITEPLGSREDACDQRKLWQCLDAFKLSKILQDSSSHRIFRRMHGALNVGKKNN